MNASFPFIPPKNTIRYNDQTFSFLLLVSLYKDVHDITRAKKSMFAL